MGILNPDTEQNSSERQNTEQETQNPPRVHMPKVTMSLETHTYAWLSKGSAVLFSQGAVLLPDLAIPMLSTFTIHSSAFAIFCFVSFVPMSAAVITFSGS